MASPTTDMCSLESSLFKDIRPEGDVDSVRSSSIKMETSNSPSPDSKRKELQARKHVPIKMSASSWTEDVAESNGQQQQSTTNRKKRARTTPSEDSEASGRKSVTDPWGRESNLWPGTEGEGPVQGSLLEEVLAEKRMALMRSPEVIHFLQQRQLLVQEAQQRVVLEAQQMDFCVGEVEEDANS